MKLIISTEEFKSEFGSLSIDQNDEITVKLAMLLEGECGEEGPSKAAAKFGYSRQRYFQLRAEFLENGADALAGDKRGPKTKTRCHQEVVCQIIRHRFLDPEASTAVIGQKLRQSGHIISKRSVDRVIANYGLQKKTLRDAPSAAQSGVGHVSHASKKPARKGRLR